MSQAIKKLLKWISNLINPTPKEDYDLDDLILDLRLFNNQMKNLQTSYKKRAVQLWSDAKNHQRNENREQVKLLIEQRMGSLDRAFTMEMFSIKMDDFLYQLKNASIISDTAETLGKTKIALEKLKIFDVDTKTLVNSTFKLMSKLSQETDNIMGRLENYSPYDVRQHTSEQVQKEINLLEVEVATETVPPDAASKEREDRRRSLGG